VSTRNDVNKKKSSRSKTFGDHIGEKDIGHIRIVSQNINCLGVVPYNNPKQDRAINWLIRHEVDIIGWQEVGIAFHMLPHSQRLSERLQDPRWAKHCVSSTNNKHEKVEKFQYDGTAVATFDQAAHRVSSTGGDTSGLGRWSWILFEGHMCLAKAQKIGEKRYITNSEGTSSVKAIPNVLESFFNFI